MADNENKKAEVSAAPAEKKEKADKAVKAKKKDKPSVWKRMGAWFRSLKSEMKKIVWTSRKTTVNNSVMVIVAIVIFAAAIGLLDYLFSQGIVALNKLI